MTSMRPDELAAQSQIERAQGRDRMIKSGLKTAAGIGLAAASPLASKIAPFLSSYVPVDLAVKGINKISPQLGNFLKKGMEKGLDVKEGLNYIKENMMGGSENEGRQEPAKEGKNIIQQYSPQLFQFLKDLIGKGQNPLQAGAIAQNNKQFSQTIKKMMKDHKMNWSDIIQGIFGSGETAQPQQTQQQGMGQAGQQRQMGQNEQQLLGILQKINQRLGQ